MKPTVFLLTDTQIKEESFLEDVDSLLNTGEVPNLFAVDEKAELNEVPLAKRLFSLSLKAVENVIFLPVAAYHDWVKICLLFLVSCGFCLLARELNLVKSLQQKLF